MKYSIDEEEAEEKETETRLLELERGGRDLSLGHKTMKVALAQVPPRFKKLKMTDRQLHAIQNPCRIVEQCEGRALKFAAGDQFIVTALTVRLFVSCPSGRAGEEVVFHDESSWHWCASVAILQDGDFKAVKVWDYNDKSAAVDLASDLLTGVGAGPEGAGEGHYEAMGVHLLRPLTRDEKVMVKNYCTWLAPLPVPKKKSIGKMWFSNVNPRANGAL